MFDHKEDKTTNGALSNLIWESWNKYKAGDTKCIAKEELQRVHEILLDFAPSVFGPIAENVWVPENCARDTKPDKTNLNIDDQTIFPKNSDSQEDFITFFPEPGFILYDGSYASGSGKMNYIYKAKGMRFVWFKNGEIGIYAFYSKLDEDGFSISYEDVDSYNIFTDSDFSMICEYVGDGEFVVQPQYNQIGDTYFWIKALANINIQYERSYYLEYLLNPIDVQKLSKFSDCIREDLWSTVFDYSIDYFEHNGVNQTLSEFIHYYFNFLAIAGIDVPTPTLVSFTEAIIQTLHPGSQKYVLEVLQNLQKSVSQITDQQTKKTENRFLDCLIRDCINLQGNKIYRNSTEDERNTFISTLLDEQGYLTKDQTLWGISHGGKQAGEVDILVREEDKSLLTIIEALNLDYLDKNYISLHLNKIFTYDTAGLRHNFVIVYSSAQDFAQLWEKYTKYIPDVKFPYEYLEFTEIQDYAYTNLKICKTKHKRNGQEIFLYHIFLNMKY